jgi:solute carrier family 50 (sugar transporter)
MHVIKYQLLTVAPFGLQVRTVGYMFLLNGVVFAGIVLFTMFLSHDVNRAKILGWICVAFSVSVFAAPLSIIVFLSFHPSFYYF